MKLFKSFLGKIFTFRIIIFSILLIVKGYNLLKRSIINLYLFMIKKKKIYGITCKCFQNNLTSYYFADKKLVKKIEERNLNINDIENLSFTTTNHFNQENLLYTINYRIGFNNFHCSFWGTENNIVDIIDRFNEHYHGNKSLNKQIIMFDMTIQLPTNEKIDGIFSNKALTFLNTFCENYNFEERLKDFSIDNQLKQIISCDVKNKITDTTNTIKTSCITANIDPIHAIKKIKKCTFTITNMSLMLANSSLVDVIFD